MTRNGTVFRLAAASVAACLLGSAQRAHAQPFTASVFATGTSLGANSPDSITTDGVGNIWIEYGNGASSTAPPGTAGSSTIAEYDRFGNVLKTFSIGGSADGLRYNSSTNQMWVLQNQDDNSALTTINATTGATASYTYTTSTPGRGYDDVAFVGGKAFMSYTNPVNPTDPILVQATLGATTISVTPVLSSTYVGTNTATGQSGQSNTVNDPDSLALRPNGNLLLTSEADGSLTTVQNPGAGQTISFVNLISSTGAKLTGLDDTISPSDPTQRLLVADTANNIVYALQGPFQVGAAYGSLSSTNSVDLINLTTGVSTSITDGLFGANASPHGLAFVASVPEPSTLMTSAISILVSLGYAGLRRKKQAVV